MKIKRNILFAIILFTVALFCFEANTHFHYNTPLFNIENTSDTETGEDKCNSNNESYDDCKINFNTDFSNLKGINHNIPQSSAIISTYIISVWQPPKIS